MPNCSLVKQRETKNTGKGTVDAMLGVDQETLIFHEGYDFDDEHEGGEEPMDEEHPMWRSERISLTSVGIDIGSSTSHLIFSRLILRRQGLALSSRFVVVKREILYESPILLTPYLDRTTIDTKQLGEFIHNAYQRANLTPKDIDTGAVIVPGEAAKIGRAHVLTPDTDPTLIASFFL